MYEQRVYWVRVTVPGRAALPLNLGPKCSVQTSGVGAGVSPIERRWGRGFDTADSVHGVTPAMKVPQLANSERGKSGMYSVAIQTLPVLSATAAE